MGGNDLVRSYIGRTKRCGNKTGWIVQFRNKELLTITRGEGKKAVLERHSIRDLKVYIGESIAGNAIIEQISSFNKEIGIDAVILTKLDCDPKGGTMLSINKVTGIPIIYVGVGQAYEDLELFDAQGIVERIVE